VKTYKVALIVGHEVNGKDKGAVNYRGEPESIYNYRICQKIQKQLEPYSNIQSSIFLRDGIGVSGVARKVAAFKPDLSIEFHFNSFSGIAKGCEALALEDEPESIQFADLITDHIASKLNIKERHKNGVLLLHKLSRGFRNLKLIQEASNSKFPKIIVEPVFANKKTEESTFFFDNDDKYVEVVIHSIKSYLGIQLPEAPKKEVEELLESSSTDEVSLNPLDLMIRLIDYWKSY
jgi:N-acetylmuramoyl-L-alanine amidase